MNLEEQLTAASVNMAKYHRNTIRGTLLAFSRRVIRDTPVDTGRLMGNWQSTLNVPTDAQLPVRSQSQAISEASASLARLQIGNTFWLQNNLPYAAYVENGTEKMPPAGMLRKNLSLLMSKLK
jgi:hypothetical protein